MINEIYFLLYFSPIDSLAAINTQHITLYCFDLMIKWISQKSKCNFAYQITIKSHCNWIVFCFIIFSLSWDQMYFKWVLLFCHFNHWQRYLDLTEKKAKEAVWTKLILKVKFVSKLKSLKYIIVISLSDFWPFYRLTDALLS